MLFQHFDWDLTHQVLFLYIYFAQPSYELERPALENAHTLVQRTDIFSCKFSAKVSLMLDNPFLVPSLCKLNHISLCFIQISTKSAYSLQGKQCFFWSHPRCFGPLGKFQHNIKISIKTAHVSRLFVSCDYGWTNTFRSVKRRLRNKLTNVTGLWSQERIWYPTQATIIKFKSHSFKESVYHARKKIKNIKIKI